MRVYRFGKNQFYESADHHDHEYPIEDLEKHVNAIIRRFTRRRSLQDLLDVYGSSHNLDGIILLKAHGCDKEGKWMFVDGKRKYSVQNWVNQMDGHALAILLGLCNRENHYSVYSERSIVIHPSSDVNPISLRNHHMRFYVPREGYLDDNYYRLQKVIERLG